MELDRERITLRNFSRLILLVDGFIEHLLLKIMKL